MLLMNYFRYYLDIMKLQVVFVNYSWAVSRQRIVLVNAAHGKTAYSLYVFGLCTS